MRTSGILLPISSLPSPGGIGTMGAAAREFVDFLHAAGQHYWQILPVCPTSYGDSPYQSFSTFAGNPYFIDLDQLAEAGLLTPEEYRTIDWESAPDCINYGVLYEKRYPVLRRACARLLANPPEDYEQFLADNAFWLPDYALFMALKDAHGGKSWLEWERPLRLRKPAELDKARRYHKASIDFWQAVQYLFYTQWKKLKAYANARGVEIIGDLPIYVAADSVDVWSSPQEFQLDENLLPIEVAGCPPDGFSATGQLWGNPLFDWDAMAANGYAWWVRRIRHLCGIYDVLRIDHFRGFSACWEVAFGAENARGGKWASAPGEAFFTLLKEKLGSPLPLIAEDLGIITDEVAALRDFAGLPGMRILQFAFGQEKNNPYLPHCYDKNTVVYTGTHDNDTTNGWYQAATEQEKDHYRRYLNVDGSNAAWDFIRLALSSPADTAILPLQDVLSLGTEHRMNIPGTPRGNWGFTFSFDWWQEGFSEGLRYLSALFGRNEQAEKAAEETDEFLR